MAFTLCPQCGVQLDEDPSLAPQDRLPCRVCGSTRRRYVQSLEGEVHPRAMLAYKARNATGLRPHREGRSGSSWSTTLKRWLKLDRTIDRQADAYEETLTDPDTGAVLQHTQEPLTKHTGHGSAKGRKHKT